jgi:hypothetical protein
MVLRKAWSVRLMAAAAILSALEVALPLFADRFPRGLFALLSAVTVAAALVARIIAQRELHE